jgi:hypothetical protein
MGGKDLILFGIPINLSKICFLNSRSSINQLISWLPIQIITPPDTDLFYENGSVKKIFIELLVCVSQWIGCWRK